MHQNRGQLTRSVLTLVCAAALACERRSASLPSADGQPPPSSSAQTPTQVHRGAKFATGEQEVVPLPSPRDAGAEPKQVQLPCEAPDVHSAIVDLLFADDEWRMYVCQSKCGKASFERSLETKQEILRDEPRSVACFVRPTNAAMQVLIAVVLLDGMKPASYFNYEGIHIGPDREGRRTLGYLDLLGEERESAETWVTHRFRWSGKAHGYIHVSTRERSDEE